MGSSSGLFSHPGVVCLGRRGGGPPSKLSQTQQVYAKDLPVASCAGMHACREDKVQQLSVKLMEILQQADCFHVNYLIIFISFHFDFILTSV